MNVGIARDSKLFIEFTDPNVETLSRYGAGMVKMNEITLIYRLTDFYFVGWLYSQIFYCDKNEIDANNNVKDECIASALSNAGIVSIESVRFEFSYTKLPMEKIQTQWSVAEKLLKSKKLDDRKRGVASIIVLTSESWRFSPIKMACRKNLYSLDMTESVWDYIDDPREILKEIKYTLRKLINDWKDIE